MVRLVTGEGYSIAAAQAVGVGGQRLRKWHARLAPQPSACDEDASVEELRAENDGVFREGVTNVE